eukprot:TRINITY_DN856_c0_g1_i1.p1 TRINITY_DN856_c0_g1~~TRINITY_DN856_c0_g1_i1.p1  ORF type:complete len:352 (-),score=151.13 TRINITY_DN856_c0_g1_i1:32-1045(-)
MNQAFVFIKPHANTKQARALVRDEFANRDIEIVREGELTAQQIDEQQLIDQHYYAIASKATILEPSALAVPEAKFASSFGLEWKDALAQGIVFNAKQACVELGIDSAQLDTMWATAKREGKLVKFGGGFYCGALPKGDSTIYVFNGFFMAMREKFVAKGVSIYYFVVQWDAAKLSWADFRGQVLGPTDPSDAPADSLRGQILANWETLGLTAVPNVGDNGVHASASPFEALAERLNWLGADLNDDAFGKALLDAGVSRATIDAWCVDPQVTYGPTGVKSSLFDALEDTDVDECLALCQMISLGAQFKKSPVEPVHAIGAFGVGLLVGGAVAYAVAKK